MARKNRNQLYDLPPLELRCMKALWGRGQATVHQIRAALLPDRPLAYTTVMTVMDRLLRKGLVEREKRGHSHLYRPAVAEETIRNHALHQFIENFFQGSRNALRRHLESGGNTAPEAVTAGPNVIEQAKPENARTDVAARSQPGMDTSLL